MFKISTEKMDVWVKNTVDINIRSQDVLVHVYTKSRWPIYRTQFNNL